MRLMFPVALLCSLLLCVGCSNSQIPKRAKESPSSVSPEFAVIERKKRLEKAVNAATESAFDKRNLLNRVHLFPVPRDEFELKTDFVKRISRFDNSKVYHFDVQVNYGSYDIDRETITLVIEGKELCSSPGPYVRCFERDLGFLLHSDVKYGEYLAENSFSAKKQILSMSGNEYHVQQSGPFRLWYGYDSLQRTKRKKLTFSLPIQLRMEPEEAKRVKKGEITFIAKLGVKLCGSQAHCRVETRYFHEPTMTEPIDADVRHIASRGKIKYLVLHREGSIRAEYVAVDLVDQ